MKHIKGEEQLKNITHKIKQSFAILAIFMLVFSWFPASIGAEESAVLTEESNVQQTEEHLEEDTEETESEETTNDQADESEENEEESSKKDAKTSEDDQNEDENADKEESKEEDESSSSKEQADAEAPKKESDTSTTEKDASDVEEKTTQSITYDTETVTQEVNKAIERTKAYYESHNPYEQKIWDGSIYKGSHSDYWTLSALWGAGYKDLKNDFPWNGSSPWSEDNYWSQEKEDLYVNEVAGIIIGSAMLGMDITDFGDRDIVAEVLEKQKEDELFHGIETDAILFIGLDLLEVEYDRESHINAMVNTQLEDGSFSRYTKSDAIGWVMMALAPYKEDSEEVEEAIHTSVEWIHDTYMNTDEFENGSEANSNSISAIIMGLVSIGEDVYSDKWVKDDVSFVDLLLEYQQEDGSFWWSKQFEGSLEMATSQSLVALATVHNGKTPFEQYGMEDSEGEKEEEEETPKESDDEEASDDDKHEVPAGEDLKDEDDSSPVTDEVESDLNPDLASDDTDGQMKLEEQKNQVTMQSKTADRLPDTATHMFNNMLIGFILLSIGVGFWFAKRNKQRS